MEGFWDIAATDAEGNNRLQKYGEWIMIDKIARTYSYSHDEVFALSWTEAMTIIAYNKESNYIEHKANEYKRQSKPK